MPGQLDAFTDKFVEIGCGCVSAMKRHVGPTEIIGENENNIRLRGRRSERRAHRPKQRQYVGKRTISHGDDHVCLDSLAEKSGIIRPFGGNPIEFSPHKLNRGPGAATKWHALSSA